MRWTSYAAYGLRLRSSFSLPGMPEATPGGGPPTLILELETTAELEAVWSGSVAPAPWRGRLGDGEELTIEWGVGGDLRFGYGERADFRLDPDGGRLGCAPRDADDLDWQRVLLSRILPNVSIARGREALHASSVEGPCGVVAIAAPSGTGKSTLARELMRRGWPLFADDVLVLSRGEVAVEAEAGTPHMNLAADGDDAEDPGTTLAELGGERWVAVEGAADGPRRVAAVVILGRGMGFGLRAEPLRRSPIVLAPYMLGLPDQPARDASRFSLYSDLVESACLIGLTGSPADRPGELADALERALGVGVPMVAGGSA